MSRALVAAALLSGCSTVAEVRDDSGKPVPGAEVFLNGVSQGKTDGAGRIAFSGQLSDGDHLFARDLVYEQPSYRPDHGAGQGWVEHVYQMSWLVNDDGSITDHEVTDPSAIQQLDLSPTSTLIGWHLVVSMNWDASEDEFDQLDERFQGASQYLFDLTDGQFYLERVELADAAVFGGSAEILFSNDTNTWPHATYNGGFLGPPLWGAPNIQMAPFRNDEGLPLTSSSTEPSTLVHELGHLALTLMDEYIGFNLGGNYCTEARHSGTDPDFLDFGSRAACAMDNQTRTHKLCSRLDGTAHHGFLLQVPPCWDTVAGGYRDPQGGTPRWQIVTPDLRGAVVGTLPELPKGLQTDVHPTNIVGTDLCTPFRFVDPAGPAAFGGAAVVVPAFQGAFPFSLGLMGPSGQVHASGVHLGDVILTPHSTVTVDSSICAPTQ